MWFQTKRSSHWRCSIKKGVLKNFAIITRKHLRQSLFLIKLQVSPFKQNNSGRQLLQKRTRENLKPKLFNLGLLASLCNFNYLQIFVKAKFIVVKCNSKTSIIYHKTKFRKGIVKRSSIKKAFLKISQYSQKNTCVGVSFFFKKACLQSWKFIKKWIQHRRIPVNIAKFLRKLVLKNIMR